MASGRSILVSGGGIAGLTTALALSRRGYRVEVHEQAEAFQSVGAGIQLAPNAMRILNDLGVARALKLTATAPDGIRILSAKTNREIVTVPLGSEVISRYGLPYLSMHRADLHTALLTACERDGDISIRTGSRITDAAVHPNGVSILATSRDSVDTIRGRMLIVADGVRSKLRDEADGGSGSVHSGFEAWRAMIRAENLPPWLNIDFTHLVMGPGAHAVLYPVSNRRYVNIVICVKSREKSASLNNEANRDDLLARLRSWSGQMRELVQSTIDWSIWPILHRPKTMLWEGGPVAFVGDAAHAMTPFAAQGAAMAIEDAAVLAQSVERHGATPDALKAYASARKSRLAKVRSLSHTNGRIYHLGWPMSLARDLSMKAMPKARLLTRQSWIYDWQA